MFAKKSFCFKGHTVAKHPSPHRMCCSECRQKLGEYSYCCSVCKDINWLCVKCVKFVEHPLQIIARDTSLAYNNNDKLIHKKMNLNERREKFKQDLKDTRNKLDMIVGPSQYHLEGSVSNNQYPRAPFTQIRPRRHLASTPKSFFNPRTHSQEMTSNLRLQELKPLQSRQLDLKKEAMHMKSLSDSAHDKRIQHHETAMEEFARRTASRGKEMTVTYKQPLQDDEDEEIDEDDE